MGGAHLPLPLLMALRSLRHHLVVALATVLGVAIGMGVVASILVVDRNTHEIKGATDAPAGRSPLAVPATSIAPGITEISFERGARARPQSRIVPSQKGATGNVSGAGGLINVRGAEDYAAMRLAVRLASLLAFLVGAVIVFYTMRFSVVARAREFSLLLCLGESRGGVVASLLAEASILGVCGTALGLAMGIPAGRTLLAFGISTTGQFPAGTYYVPWAELSAMAAISVAVALLGVAGPARAVFRMEVARVLQPRFLTDDATHAAIQPWGLVWLLPPAIAAAYVLVRPFLLSWLSVVHFFLFEAAFVTVLAVATLWWVRPVLSGSIAVFERLLRPFLPLEVLLTGRRLRLGSRQFVFAVTGVVLVFAMLTALHDITRALKTEIIVWAEKAMMPNLYYGRTSIAFDAAEFATLLRRNGLSFIRLSAKIPGKFPIRLVMADDVNAQRQAQGRPTIRPGTVVLSSTLAARFALEAGDRVVIRRDAETHRFTVIEVADDLGLVPRDGRYVDLRSYAVFSDGNPLFADNLERTLGQHGVARFADGTLPWLRRLSNNALYPYYLITNWGAWRGYLRRAEIDRDFLIFDFILFMTIGLAAIGVANTLLIQVHGRKREFAVLRSIGMNRWQVVKMQIAEGVIVGLVGALLASVIGNLLGAVSVSFLDHFTLFDYRFQPSLVATGLIFALCVGTCFAAALYPALIANRISSAESLHYE